MPLSSDNVRAGGSCGKQRSAEQQRSTDEGLCHLRCGEVEGEGQAVWWQLGWWWADVDGGNSRLLVLTQNACLFSVMCSSSICRLGRMKSLSNSSGAPRRLSPMHRTPPPPMTPQRSLSLPCCGSEAWSTSGVESLSAPPPRPPPPRHSPPPELLPSLRR